ncbi:Acetate kinase [Gemmatirosa kalamazoonensis]|uniref:Acetate kinase n=1 Tax=Gemmatirosa kalamazoonensis TaxID=861299 RepID=W0RPC2_9BACT|nr:acetate kinase [Gemmatirosa kalamazoonensis]AHG91323.1 Acetate kinase [Gemmatirosa kalamazoonensis]
MNVLVLNVGSSSLKFQLVRTDAERMSANTDEKLARGTIERLGGESVISLKAGDGPSTKTTAPLRDHRAAVEFIMRWLVSDESGGALGGRADVEAVGHRVVHGGEHFTRSVLIDDTVLRGIEENIDLAPLHNPANLKGIAAARAVLGAGTPQVAVFDTAFHQTLPDHAYLYAIPYQFYRRYKVRRYGFHGTSHRYVAHRWRQLTGTARDDTRLVTLHLGNGCSACAISGGDSVDTSMGFTPLEGLVMGTRSGDVDPAVLEYLSSKEGMTMSEAETMLNKSSGLLGVSGLTHDMRELLAEAEEHDDRRARLAIEIFCHRARKYIGAYLAEMGGADAVVFAGGIGENAPTVRARIVAGLDWLGLTLDAERNAAAVGREGKISTDDARLAAWVIPTDEELLIARDTVRVVTGAPARF